MTPFQKDIISIIRSAFTSKIPNLSDGVDYSRIYNFAVKHQIVCILYEGLVGREDFKADGIYPKVLYDCMRIFVAQYEAAARAFGY